MLPVSEGINRLPVNEQNPVSRSEENRDFTYSSGWNFSIISKKHSNNYGFLNDNDYHREVNTPLMAIVGDSYVEALQVENHLAMHGVLSKKVGNQGRVYSFGKLGAPMSTYLVYVEYAHNEFSPGSIVFIIVGNDFDQSLYKYEKDKSNYYFLTNAHNGLFLRELIIIDGLLENYFANLL